MRALSSLLLLVAAVPAALALKTEDWKTCSQAAFCRRGRALNERASSTPDWKSPYSIDPSSVAFPRGETFTAAVKSSLYPEIKFGLEVRVHKDGVVRVRMDEVGGLRKHYDEAASWALIVEPEVTKNLDWVVGKTEIRAFVGPKEDKVELVVSFDPLKVALYRNGKEQVVLNGLGLLHMEHFRSKDASRDDAPVPEEGLDAEDAQTVMKSPNPRAWFEGDQEDGYWEETFRTWTDSKPKGECVEVFSTCQYSRGCQDRNPSRLISASLIMVTYTEFHSMPPA